MRALIVGLGALLLTGCASVAANSNGGVVEGAISAKSAMTKAEAECAKVGKTALTTGYDRRGHAMTFQCVVG